MDIRIDAERPDTPAALELIGELDAYLEATSPPGSRHAFSVARLLEEQVAFFVTRADGVAVGCGGIKLFAGYGELKRMYVRPALRGHGLARQMIEHLAEHAHQHGIALLRLETGINQRDAIRLYEQAGFRQIGPFGSYQPSVNNLFFERAARHGT